MIWSGAIGAGPASAAKLGVSVRGSITDPGSGLSGDGWGTVVETTSAHRINCTFPTAIYCSADYGLTLGLEVSLRADAPPGWRFDHWIQGGDGQVTCDTGTPANVCRFHLWFWDLSIGAYFVDETPPDVVLDSGPPPATNSDHAVFAFHSPDDAQYNPVRFVCHAEVLDPPVQAYDYGCGPSGWDWPMTYEGHYRVTVIGRDASGNLDPSPPVVEFTVDRVAPDTAINTGPTGTVWQRYATFTFSGTDPNGGFSGDVAGSGVARFECRLDGGAWNACPSGVGFDELGQGSHTFDVRAVDAAGNADSTPSSRSWTIVTPGCFGRFATMVGTAGADVLTGTAGPDVIVGLGGNDTINGAGGDDMICGGEGNDSLHGGPGVDRLDGGNGADIADYKAAPGGETINLSLDPGTASGGDGNDPALMDIETVQGSAYADSITGSYVNETLVGNGGNDTLSGLEGNDTLRGGPGADSLNGGSGTDTADYQSASAGVTVDLTTGTASGGEGADPSLVSIESVLGSAFGDKLTGSAGANTLIGGGGNDILGGADGNDTLRGGPGADVFDGGAGTDTVDYQGATAGVTVSLATQTASGGEGSDSSFVSIEGLRGSAYADSLTGSALADSLTGQGENDVLIGLGGNDVLTGGGGMDSLQGGDGNDTAYARDSARDTVDGGPGTGDRAQVDAALDTVTNNETLIP
jgi:Ca2+-binding RTX toxin-like protein